MDGFDPHLFIRNLPELSEVSPSLFLQPKEIQKRSQVTLVLDLDGKQVDTKFVLISYYMILLYYLACPTIYLLSFRALLFALEYIGVD